MTRVLALWDTDDVAEARTAACPTEDEFPRRTPPVVNFPGVSTFVRDPTGLPSGDLSRSALALFPGGLSAWCMVRTRGYARLLDLAGLEVFGWDAFVERRWRRVRVSHAARAAFWNAVRNVDIGRTMPADVNVLSEASDFSAAVYFAAPRWACEFPRDAPFLPTHHGSVVRLLAYLRKHPENIVAFATAAALSGFESILPQPRRRA